MQEGDLNAATLMERGLRCAVLELRRRMEWDQTQLANAIHRYGAAKKRMPAPSRMTISRWESGASLPSLRHQIILARLAGAHKLRALHKIFSASPAQWELFEALEEVRILIDPEKPPRGPVVTETAR